MNTTSQIITLTIMFLFTVFTILFNSEIKRRIKVYRRKLGFKKKTKPEGKKKIYSDMDLKRIYWE